MLNSTDNSDLEDEVNKFLLGEKPPSPTETSGHGTVGIFDAETEGEMSESDNEISKKIESEEVKPSPALTVLTIKQINDRLLALEKRRKRHILSRSDSKSSSEDEGPTTSMKSVNSTSRTSAKKRRVSGGLTVLSPGSGSDSHGLCFSPKKTFHKVDIKSRQLTPSYVVSFDELKNHREIDARPALLASLIEDRSCVNEPETESITDLFVPSPPSNISRLYCDQNSCTDPKNGSICKPSDSGAHSPKSDVSCPTLDATQNSSTERKTDESISKTSDDSGVHSPKSDSFEPIFEKIINDSVFEPMNGLGGQLEKPTQVDLKDEVPEEEDPNTESNPERKQVLIEKKNSIDELEKVSARLEELKASLKKFVLENLPDRGEWLLNTIKSKEEQVASLKEKISGLERRLEILPRGKPIPANNRQRNCDISEELPTLNQLISFGNDLDGLGEECQNLKVKRTMTVEALTNLHKALEMRPKDGEEIDDDPAGIKVPLLPHQRHALAWLIWREKQKPSGGILADDMGLGKTLTMLSLLAYGKNRNEREDEYSDSDSSENESNYEDDDFSSDFKPRYRRKKYRKGGTLVVCPSSVVEQWAVEIMKKLRKNLLSFSLHHGPKRETKTSKLAKFDVVLTTYAIMQKAYIAGPENVPLTRIRWKRVILDEGHIIRNYKSQTAMGVYYLKAKHRWVLTGTPVHNRELDFYSLLRFLKCAPFDDLEIWKDLVDNRNPNGMRRLNCITKSLLLRRTKEQIKEKGGLTDLKLKEFTRIAVDLDPEEIKVYEKIAHFSSTLLAHFIYQKAQKQNLFCTGVTINNSKRLMKFGNDENPFKDHPELARLHKKMMSLKEVETIHIIVLLLRLRQICCHPSLISAMLEQNDLHDFDDDVGNMDMRSVHNMNNLLLPDVKSDDDDEPSESFVLTPSNPVFEKKRISSKMRSVITCVKKILDETSDKVIVVSQWTSVLFLLEGFLRSDGIRTVGLNGTVPVKDRGKIIDDFNTKKYGPRVMLLSLTAGGTGLNLIGANHLLLIDIHWNPQLEAQAADRVHRVGQTKDVMIYKFVCTDTIEERIEQLQQEKLTMASNILNGSMKLQSTKLTIEDLKLLFNLHPKQRPVRLDYETNDDECDN